MRIFLGTNGLGRYGELLKEGLEANGCNVALCDDRPHRTRTFILPDFCIHDLRSRLFTGIDYSHKPLPRLVVKREFYSWLEQFDAFIFWFADSLAPAHLDIPYLYAANKKVIFISAGDDMMYAPFEQLRKEWRGSLYLKQMSLEQHKCPIDFSELVANWFTHFNTLARRMFTYRVFESFDFPLVLCSGCNALARKPFYRFFYRIPYPELLLKGRNKALAEVVYPIQIRHYSSNPITKDTHRIEKIFRNHRLVRLVERGLLDLKIVSKIDHTDLFGELLKDDFIVDQLAAFGAMSWEASSLATPAFSGPDYEGYQDPLRDIITIQVWNDEQLVDRIEHLGLNLYAATSLRKKVYHAAVGLTPKLQAKHFLDEVILGNECSSLHTQPWGSLFLDEAMNRLALNSEFLKIIDRGDLRTMMLDIVD